MKLITKEKPEKFWLSLCIVMVLTLVSCSNETQNLTNKKVRIITLAPHLAELVASAGALDNLVGVVSYSDFPQKVMELPHVGDAFKLDYEAILSLSPDIILTWRGGTPQGVIEKLKSLNLTVVETEIKELADIAKVIEQISVITSSQEFAHKSIQIFSQTLTQYKHQHYRPQTTFIEISPKPLYTVSSQHWMSEAVSICGFMNIYSELKQLSAPITLESLISHNPQTILNISKQVDNQWQQWQTLQAVKNNRILTLSPDYLSRPTMRILTGIEKLCQFNQLSKG